MCIALGACVSYKPYPDAPPLSDPAAKAALYQEYSIQRDDSGGYHAQGKPIYPEYYISKVEPSWLNSDPKELIRLRDLAWLAAVAATLSWQFNIRSDPSDYGLAHVVGMAVPFGFLMDYSGRLESRSEKASLNWDRSLANALGQPEPTAFAHKTVRYDDTLPGWKWGLGFSTTRRSGQDYQDYFTPGLGSLSFRFDDLWTEGAQLSVGYGFASFWTLELEAEAPGSRKDGVVWRGSNFTQTMGQYLYQGSIRFGRAWGARVADQVDLSVMPLVGLGIGWMRGDGTETDVNGKLLGSYIERSTAPAVLAGLRLSISTSPRVSYTLETGYRWLRFDYMVVTEGEGIFAGRSSPDATLRGAPATWDCRGPFIKIGLMFL